jgi:putative membrane protein
MMPRSATRGRFWNPLGWLEFNREGRIVFSPRIGRPWDAPETDMTVRSNEARNVSGTLPATLSASCVLIGGVVVVSAHQLGPASTHMAVHIGLMNLVAPLAAAALALGPFAGPSRPGAVWSAAITQMVLLWCWHAPPLQQFLLTSHVATIAGHTFLFVSALWFWWSLLRLTAWARWQAVAALLITGKLACLLGVLLTFSPRLLLGIHDPATTLSDQQLAGLLMITACPLSYVVAGVVLAAQLVGGAQSSWNAPNAFR